MAASMYIVVEGEDPGFDIYVNGRFLARHEAALERMAQALGVPPLLEFFSADETAMALLIEEGAGNPELLHRLPPTQWFPPENGLRTVEALLDALRGEQERFGRDREPLCGELAEYQLVLQKAAARRLRWHLAFSWR